MTNNIVNLITRNNPLFSMMGIIILIFGSFVAVGCGNQKSALIIKNANIIDVQSGSVITNKDIRITDNYITDINENIDPAKKDRVIDATGKYIIPGLWDMHVHFEMWDYEPMAGMMIANGVLGARDMGGDDLERLDTMIENLGKELPHMRVIRSGKMLDGATDNWPFRTTVTDSAQAYKAVANNKALGVDFIKVHQQLNRESYFAIAAACKLEGIEFFGHVPVGITGIEASKAGQSSIEHLTSTPWCFDESCENAEETLSEYIANSTFQTPTLMVYHSGERRHTSGLISEEYKQYLNPMAKHHWAVQDSINEKFMPPMEQRPVLTKRIAQSAYWLTGKMFQMDVPIVTGTDAGYVGVIPGFDLHEELRLMVEKAGATPLQALQAATINPVRLHDIEKLGAVTQGNYADLLILNQNPLLDIGATRDIFYVITNGEGLDRPKLEELKGQSKAH